MKLIDILNKRHFLFSPWKVSTFWWNGAYTFYRRCIDCQLLQLKGAKHLLTFSFLPLPEHFLQVELPVLCPSPDLDPSWKIISFIISTPESGQFLTNHNNWKQRLRLCHIANGSFSLSVAKNFYLIWLKFTVNSIIHKIVSGLLMHKAKNKIQEVFHV